jgi:pyruvate ferredoxin oxidoreductase alpha subunit
VQVLPDDLVKKFVGTRQFPLVTNHEGKMVPFKLDPQNPVTMGPLDLYDYYFEHKRQQEEAMAKAPKIIREVHEEYAKISGRRYGDSLTEPHYLQDAEMAIVCVGSTSGTVKTVVNELRSKGMKAGLLRLRTFRPLPVKEITKALENVKAVAVMDRSLSFGGHGGPVFHEIRHILYDASIHPHVVNYIYGLGGRDTHPNLIHKIYRDLQQILETRRVKEPVQFIGLRE